MPKKTKKENLKESLRKLSAIAAWFENQEEIDVEEGLEKVKEAAALLGGAKQQLKEIENKFEEIVKDLKKDA